MFQKENPGPRAIGTGAGIDTEQNVLDIRPRLKAQETRRLCRQSQVARICRIPRLVTELIEEIARHHPEIADDLDRRLDRYASLDAALLRWAGGDRFSASPIRVVGAAL